MVSRNVVELARYSIQVNGRYDNQEFIRVGCRLENMRKDWTSAQIRRMRKKFNKKRKTIQGS
jgi:hypothetical protein